MHSMSTESIRTKLNLDVVRLKLFLENNQLVQAHGVAHTIDRILKEAIDEDCAIQHTRADQHKWFYAFKSIVRIEPKILQGDTKSALSDANDLLSLLAKLQDGDDVTPEGGLPPELENS